MHLSTLSTPNEIRLLKASPHSNCLGMDIRRIELSSIPVCVTYWILGAVREMHAFYRCVAEDLEQERRKGKEKEKKERPQAGGSVPHLLPLEVHPPQDVALALGIRVGQQLLDALSSLAGSRELEQDVDALVVACRAAASGWSDEGRGGTILLAVVCCDRRSPSIGYAMRWRPLMAQSMPSAPSLARKASNLASWRSRSSSCGKRGGGQTAGWACGPTVLPAPPRSFPRMQSSRNPEPPEAHHHVGPEDHHGLVAVQGPGDSGDNRLQREGGRV